MSINITFPDGAVTQFEQPVTGTQIADGISSGLRRNAVAVEVNGQLWDLNRSIDTDANVAIVTRDTEAGLEVLRHDAAHVMAQNLQTCLCISRYNRYVSIGINTAIQVP